MDRSLYKELWSIRFNKMLKVEKQSIEEYKKLLENCRAINKDHSVIPHLEGLVRDETRHAQLCEQLLHILEKQIE